MNQIEEYIKCFEDKIRPVVTILKLMDYTFSVSDIPTSLLYDFRITNKRVFRRATVIFYRDTKEFNFSIIDGKAEPIKVTTRYDINERIDECIKEIVDRLVRG